VQHECMSAGDRTDMSIAAASIIAKTYRDDYMVELGKDFPHYDWATNKGYPTVKHRTTVLELGFTPHHRKTFTVTRPQLTLFENKNGFSIEKPFLLLCYFLFSSVGKENSSNKS